MRRMLFLLLCIWLVLAMGVTADTPKLITNGDFESTFQDGVAAHWQVGNSGQDASYEYTPGEYVAEGAQSQTLIIHTLAVGGSQRDLYSWLAQPVRLDPTLTYRLSLQALVQSSEGDELASGYNYRLQVGVGTHGLLFPWDVDEWIELPCPEWPLTDKPSFARYEITFKPANARSSIFIRAWKKFPTIGQRGIFTIDDVRLEPLAAPSAPAPTATLVAMSRPALPLTGGSSPLLYLGTALGMLVLLVVFWRLYHLR